MSRTHSPWLYAVIVAITAMVFVADWFTRLGVAVWFLYVVPVGLTMFGRQATGPVLVATAVTLLMTITLLTDAPGIVAWVAQVNRVCGVVVIWGLAFIARVLIQTRALLEVEEWIRSIEARLLVRLQGERTVGEIGERVIATLVEAAQAPAAAFYHCNGVEYRLAAAYGVQGSGIPESFERGQGLHGGAVATGRVMVLGDLPDTAFPLRSAFIGMPPRHLLLVPLVADDDPQGALELACLTAPAPELVALLERSRHSVAVALRTAAVRSQNRVLLEETQRQARSLEQQQEELTAANEELEEQSQALRVSQAQLEEQQAELEATNAQLEVQTEELEHQREGLVRARHDAERASRYKSEFLANMSHELRTPLNSTLILSKLLAQNKDARLSDEQVRFAETIHSSGMSLLALINDILDLAKIEAGATAVRVEAVDVRTLAKTLDATFRPLVLEKNLSLAVDVTGTAPVSMRTDRQRLQQILTNLLSNAVKFTERGGIVLRVSGTGSGSVAFDVRDTGPGIAAEHHEAIFEAFRQMDAGTDRRYGGTGLGLSISRQLAQLLGGQLTLTSAPGAGSTFTLTVPAKLPDAVAAVRPSPAAAPASRAPSIPHRRIAAGFEDDRNHRRHVDRLILVVEDDMAFARILYDAAHHLDFDCIVTTSNDEGLELARQLMPSGILLDVGLPDGSGLMLLDRLKRTPETRHIPVHVLSVHDHAQAARLLGAVGYAVKPVQHEDLLDTIRQLESRLEGRVRQVLVVAVDGAERQNILEVLRMDGVTLQATGTVQEALERLASQSYDCVILVPDTDGRTLDVLEAIDVNQRYSFPPVIVYSKNGQDTLDERLRSYARSAVVKGARSPERLLAEVTLFLHQVESRLPADMQRLLRVAHERDEFFEGRTVLIVEDDIRNVFALTSVFEPRGARVTIARNGREALDALGRARPDLVLMDVMMPEMDGLAATRAIRSNPSLRDLPVIALTAKATRDDYEQCIAAGANDYLAKPLDVDKLVSLCRVWMPR